MNKKTLVILLGFIILIAIATIFVLSKNERDSLLSTSKYTPLTKDLRTKILSYTKGKEIPIKVVNVLNELNDPKITDEKKYELLTRLEFYFSSEYSTSHDPSIRTFVSEELGTFAKKNLGKYYNAYHFDIPCADPTCGNKIDNEAQKIIELISESEEINNDYKRVILTNLTTAFYIPDSNLEDKQTAMNLVIEQLERQNNKEASEAAVLLKSYYFNRYEVNL